MLETFSYLKILVPILILILRLIVNQLAAAIS